MHQLDFITRCVTPLEVIDCLEKSRIIAQRTRDSAQTAYVLRMAPACIVAAAIRVRDERDAQGLSRRGYLTGLRLRRATSSVDPSLMPDEARVAPSSRISKPRTFTT
jgi:hypothetical protein